VKSYLYTKFVRFLVGMKKMTQDLKDQTFVLVPIQDFSHSWNDSDLYKKYGLTDDEIAFIESMIKPME
jgi:site-specific DNA-methyltransferase (adenine-specific)